MGLLCRYTVKPAQHVVLGCIVYADDIIVLSTSIVALQKMLNICFHKGEGLYIMYNNWKSFLFKTGPTHDCYNQNLKLGIAYIVWTREIKYLGVNIYTDNNSCVDLSGRMRKYYAAVNSIKSHTKNVRDILKLNLLETCILKYACESLFLNHNTLDILNECWNNVFKNVFKMNRWESKNCSIFLRSPRFHSYSSFPKIGFIANYRIVVARLCRLVTNCFHIPMN